MEYKLRSSELEVRVSSIGSELIEIRRKDGSLVLWNGDEKYWKRHSPILFPFVGRLVDGAYLYRGKSYPMTIHGFISHQEFSVIKSDESILHTVFCSTEKTKEIYPFDFSFEVVYQLKENRLEASFTVANRGDEPMFYGFGLHPGFCLPMEAGLNFDDYYIEFEDHGEITQEVFSASCFDTGKAEDSAYLYEDNKIRLFHGMFDNDAICLKDTGNSLILKSDKGKRALKVIHDAPYLALWHAVKTDAPYICIEPWHSLPAMDGEMIDIETKKDFNKLLPGRSQAYKLGLEII